MGSSTRSGDPSTTEDPAGDIDATSADGGDGITRQPPLITRALLEAPEGTLWAHLMPKKIMMTHLEGGRGGISMRLVKIIDDTVVVVVILTVNIVAMATAIADPCSLQMGHECLRVLVVVRVDEDHLVPVEGADEFGPNPSLQGEGRHSSQECGVAVLVAENGLTRAHTNNRDAVESRHKGDRERREVVAGGRVGGWRRGGMRHHHCKHPTLASREHGAELA